jgi:hypothetical protein
MADDLEESPISILQAGFLAICLVGEVDGLAVGISADRTTKSRHLFSS